LKRGRVAAQRGEVLFKFVEPGVEGCVLSQFPVHKAWHPGGGFDLREEGFFLALVVRMDYTVPGEAVVDEVGIIGWLHVGCLLIDAVIAENETVVDDCHVRSYAGEVIGL
jgi:hypothetical protein